VSAHVEEREKEREMDRRAPRSSHPSLPDWLLEGYRLGELDPARQAEVEQRLACDPALRAHLEGLAASDREILTALPPAQVAGRVRRMLARPETHPARRPLSGLAWRGLAVGVPLAAAALLLLVAHPADGPVPPDQPSRAATGIGPGADEATRIKGLAPRLFVHRQRAGHTEALNSGDRVQPGDLLQLSYQAAGQGYGAVLSLDGQGAVTVHLPEAAAEAAPLLAGEAVPLPRAFELDAAPGFERFFLVTSATPFALAPTLAAAAALARRPDAARQPLELPADLNQTSLLLSKE